jgi:hypothetical protein
LYDERGLKTVFEDAFFLFATSALFDSEHHNDGDHKKKDNWDEDCFKENL